MGNAIASGEGLYRYIPQRPPMVMVDSLLRNDEELTRTSFRVQEGNLFLEHGSFREAGLVENIAQTAAAGVGHYYVEQKDGNGEPPVGFIASVKDLEVRRMPGIGDELLTEVRVKQEVMNMTIITARVERQKELMASCEMRIYLQDGT